MAHGATGSGNQSGEVQNRQFEETVVGLSGFQSETTYQEQEMGGQVSNDRKGVPQVQGYYPSGNSADSQKSKHAQYYAVQCHRTGAA